MIHWVVALITVAVALFPTQTQPRTSASAQAGAKRKVAATAPANVTLDHGGIVRGPRDSKVIALVFTGGDYGEGAPTILDALKARRMHASFFVTGGFLKAKDHQPYLRRIIKEGHYLGPHSYGHLLYCPWSDREKTLVSKEEFRADLQKNLDALAALGIPRTQLKFFLPAYEWYNNQIVDWASELGLVTVNFTSGTRSNSDYLPDKDRRFISSAAIYQGILDYEAQKPDGLNGFLLLLHVGVGPGRTDKMHTKVGELIDELTKRGYRFVRVDEMLAGQTSVRPTTRPDNPDNGTQGK
jgi:peptidoglycan/xylan/chitin deacetylase (PgdA/CDA1 family)